MRRAGNLWPQIVAFDNLMQAARRAAAGKRSTASVARFLERSEYHVLALQRELEDGSYRPGRPVTFEIIDPKPRTISAAPFRDRVVHHALIDPLEPVLERRMIAASFACRRGKGRHNAECGMRNAERRPRFRIPHSAFQWPASGWPTWCSTGSTTTSPRCCAFRDTPGRHTARSRRPLHEEDRHAAHGVLRPASRAVRQAPDGQIAEGRRDS